MMKTIFKGIAGALSPQVLRAVYKEKRLEAPSDPGSKRGKNGEASKGASTDDLLGLLRIRVVRGANLVIKDIRTSDPYVVIKLGKQKVKTRVMKKTLNPVWNEDLTLPVSDPDVTFNLMVYDYDTFKKDDKMGDAEFDIKVYIDALKNINMVGLSTGAIVSTTQPSSENCLAQESMVSLVGGQLVQDMCLRLRNVKSGEVDIQLQWIELPGSKGLTS